MKKITAIAISALTATILASCTCPACGGSGLQVRTEHGLVPYAHGSVAGSKVKTVTCVRCKGSGDSAANVGNWVNVVGGGLKTATSVAGDVKYLTH